MNKFYLTTSAILLAIPSVFATTADFDHVVVVKTANGPVRIPAREYDAKQHELHVADELHDEHGVLHSAKFAPQPQPIAPAAPGGVAPVVAPIAPALPPYGVMNKGTRFFIVSTADGAKIIDNAQIDPNGYTSNADAWGVITAVNLQATPAAAS